MSKSEKDLLKEGFLLTDRSTQTNNEIEILKKDKFKFTFMILTFIVPFSCMVVYGNFTCSLTLHFGLYMYSYILINNEGAMF